LTFFHFFFFFIALPARHVDLDPFSFVLHPGADWCLMLARAADWTGLRDRYGSSAAYWPLHRVWHYDRNDGKYAMAL
jgi:hypothetical protein